MLNTKTKKTIGRTGDRLFQLALLAWPLLQFIIFYIIVNANSFVLAFQGRENVGFSWEHFEYIFSLGAFKDAAVFSSVLKAMGMSFLFYAITTAISVPLALFFAYYIFKKGVGGRLFRLFLFLPSIVSSMVMVTLYIEFLSSDAYQLLSLMGVQVGDELLFDRGSTSSYPAVIFFYLWTNFGTTTLIYSNKMGEISPETIEAAQLDGANSWQELIYVVLPFTFPTLSVFLVTGFATVFANQYNLFSFYGSAMPTGEAGTIGYFIFNQVQDASGKQMFDSVKFNQMAALSLVVTAIIVPLALTLRTLLEKYGPQE